MMKWIRLKQKYNNHNMTTNEIRLSKSILWGSLIISIFVIYLTHIHIDHKIQIQLTILITVLVFLVYNYNAINIQVIEEQSKIIQDENYQCLPSKFEVQESMTTESIEISSLQTLLNFKHITQFKRLVNFLIDYKIIQTQKKKTTKGDLNTHFIQRYKTTKNKSLEEIRKSSKGIDLNYSIFDKKIEIPTATNSTIIEIANFITCLRNNENIAPLIKLSDDEINTLIHKYLITYEKV